MRLWPSGLWLAESPGDPFFDSFWGGVGQDSRRPPRKLSRRLLFDFLSRGGFWLLCQAGGGSQSKLQHTPQFAQPHLSRSRWHRPNTLKFAASQPLRSKDWPYRNKHTLFCIRWKRSPNSSLPTPTPKFIKSPVNPYPFIRGVEVHPLNYRGWTVQSPLSYSAFWDPPP